MPSRTVAEKDARKWVSEVKEELEKKGSKKPRFKYKDLPENLKSKKLFRKAGELALIKIIERDSWKVATWGIS